MKLTLYAEASAFQPAVYVVEGCESSSGFDAAEIVCDGNILATVAEPLARLHQKDWSNSNETDLHNLIQQLAEQLVLAHYKQEGSWYIVFEPCHDNT